MEVVEAACFVYDQLEKPYTRTTLTSIFQAQYGFSLPETSARVGCILRALVERGLAVEIPPGALVPTDPHGFTKQLLRQAQQRLGAGDWSAAVTLCQEAEKDAAYANVAKLNGLIARYTGGSFDGMVEQACMLSSQLTNPAQACCDGLALLAAHQTKDLAAAKLVALHLARSIASPLELPTVPTFAVQVRGYIIVLESLAVEPMLAAITDLLAAGVGRGDENAQLEALTQRYRERQTHLASKVS